MYESGLLEWAEAGLEERTFSKTKKFNNATSFQVHMQQS